MNQAIYREFLADRSMREIAAISGLKIAEVEQIIREVLAERKKRR